jgi:Transposase and inactivated derivatives
MLEEKNRQILELKELLRLRTAEKYVPCSEQMGCLFPELEAYDAILSGEAQSMEKAEVAGHMRTKPRKKTCSAPAQTPVCDIYHTDGAASSFEKDGITYARVEDRIIEKMAFAPARFVVERHHYPEYRPVDTEASPVVVYRNEKTDRTSASPSLISDIVVRKFDDHLPLYRQEEILRRSGIYLSRQKMAQWLIAWYEMLLPLEALFRRQVYSSAFLNKDETPVLVLDLKAPSGRPAQNSFMYITIGSSYDRQERTTHVLKMFEFISGRSGDVLLEDYRKFDYDGYVMTDGLKQYGGIKADKHCVCWVHAVRQFKTILKADKSEQNAKKMTELVAVLYDIEEELRKKLLSGEIDADAFLSERKERSNSAIKEIYAFADSIKGRYSPSGAMGKALSYLYGYRAFLSNYLEAIEATPSNNEAELCAKAFATGRKNWLFASSLNGADASAFYFSLVETAKAQGLSPADYIEYVMTFAPDARTEADWEALLPWNMKVEKLSHLRAARRNAVSAPGRTKPYIFSGANGNSQPV